MDRRNALRHLAMISGGLVLIPSCEFSEEEALKAYENLGITAKDKQTLENLVGVIIPGKHLKGAKELSIQDFVLIMANDCLAESDRKDFAKGLKGIDDFTKKQFGKTFGEMDAAEGAEAFRTIMANSTATDKSTKKAQNLLGTTKRFTLQGYMTSEYYLTEISPYQLVPGGFKGSVPVHETEIIKTNG